MAIIVLALAGTVRADEKATEKSAPGLTLTDRTTLRFADVPTGQKLLAERDRFLQALSPFDRQSRLKTDRDVTEAELVRFITAQVRPWSDAEQQKIAGVVAKLRESLAAWKLPLPATITLVKTTGDEEGAAAYCRGAAIVLPQNIVDRSADGLTTLLAHESFHVLSSHNPQLRDRLYAIVGFRPLGTKWDWPESLRAKAITNPDAPVVEHLIDVAPADERAQGRSQFVVPVLFSSSARYDVRRGGKFFDYLTFRLLVLEPAGKDAQGATRWQTVRKDGQPLLLDPAKTAAYHEQIGRNTGYIIHPEEVLADNFAQLVLGRKKVATPKIHEQLARELRAAGDAKR